MYLHNSQRKPGYILVLLMALAVLAAACGQGNEPKKSAAAPSPSQTRKVVDDLNREVEVPLAPERIVAGEFAAELLTLGIKPIASGDNGFKVVYTLEEMEGVERIGDPPNPEKILELDPDLVVAPTVFLEIYPEQMERISKIAPVYYLSFDQDPIYGIYVKLAELVGKSDKAEAWIADYEREAELARERLSAAIGKETVSIFRVERGRMRIYLNRNFAGYMLHSSLKLPAPEAVAAEIEKNPNSSAVQISMEKLPEYAGDHLFIIVRGEGDDKQAFEEIRESGLWSSLDAVKKGHIHFLDTDKYYGSDIVTILETMKEAVDMLAPADFGKGN
ncbi:ABC transporter substrate-binding protein [uncultured Paenibacillus sp.]|uniref:ABC transporter substrate-binding protein n=1 Tax=uncultured Paenibacillus sp. TaxID=227322 RepID=UPI0015AF4542|nr:ABC transporter substrate-binding protein [uncultured Paenibacillus sp.]